MVTKALLKRKSRVAIALAALIIGTGVISAVISVYYDINIKMSKELRSYGANFVLASKQGGIIDESKIIDVVDHIDREKIMGYSPYLYQIGLVDEKKMVVIGLWLDQIKKVTPYWEITGTDKLGRNENDAAIIGHNVAAKLNLTLGKAITLKDETTDKRKDFVVKGIVKTGSTEDNQVFISLNAAQRIFNLDSKANIVYFSLLGKSEELSSAAKKLNESVPGIELKPIKQISQSEAKILEKIKSLVYLVILVILLSTLLCLSTTMMAMVVERRKEIGLRKALGAQNRSIISEFLGEGLTLGFVGGLLGIILGIGLAQIIGQSVFKSYISLRGEVVAMVTLMSLIVAGIASVIPVKTATNIEPALILKGE
jgi:putative ABC transport system permease protein